MHVPSIFSALALAFSFAAAECNSQWASVFLQKKWRLSTYRNQNCIDQTQDTTKSGFGTWCINIPNDTRSFIFTQGTGYESINMEECTIFFWTDNSCGGDRVGRSTGSWAKGVLSTNGERMASAYVQCTRLFTKRDAAVQGTGDRFYERGEDGEWYLKRDSKIAERAPSAHDMVARKVYIR